MSLPETSDEVCCEGELRQKRCDHSLLSLKLYPLFKGQRTSSASQIGSRNFLSCPKGSLHLKWEKTYIWLKAVGFSYETQTLGMLMLSLKSSEPLKK